MSKLSKAQPENRSQVLFKDKNGDVRIGKFVIDTSSVDRPAEVYIESWGIYEVEEIDSWAALPKTKDITWNQNSPKDGQQIFYPSKPGWVKEGEEPEVHSGDMDLSGKSNMRYQNYIGSMCGGLPWNSSQGWRAPKELFNELREKGQTYLLDSTSPVQRPLPREEYMSKEEIKRTDYRAEKPIGKKKDEFYIATVVETDSSEATIGAMHTVLATNTGFTPLSIRTALKAFEDGEDFPRGYPSAAILYRSIETAQTNAIYEEEPQKIMVAKVRGDEVFQNKNNPNVYFYDGKRELNVKAIIDVSAEGDVTKHTLSKKEQEKSL